MKIGLLGPETNSKTMHQHETCKNDVIISIVVCVGVYLEWLERRVLSRHLLQCVQHAGRQVGSGSLYRRRVKGHRRVTHRRTAHQTRSLANGRP